MFERKSETDSVDEEVTDDAVELKRDAKCF
jgi:hypothetical protein